MSPHILRRLLVAATSAVALVAFVPTTTQASQPTGQFPCAPYQGHSQAGQGRTTVATYCDAQVGSLVDTTLADLHPTQPSLGYDEVYYKLGRYTMGKDTINKKFADWCEANGQGDVESAEPDARLDDPSSFTCTVAVGDETAETIDPMKTAVVGPRGDLYLTDGHHTFTSFWETPDGGPALHVRVRITGNLSSLTPAAFWRTMQANGWTWLRDNNDQPIKPQQLPDHLGLSEFGNDPYRAVLYFARDIGYRQGADIATFQEYYWGRWLRAQSDPGVALDNFDLTDPGYETGGSSYLNLVENLSNAIVALDPNAEVSDGRTAADLGRLDAFGASEWKKLKKPISDSKPGKIAYAMAYKNSL